MVPEKIIRLTLFRSHSFVSYKLHIPSFNLMLDTTRQAFTYPVDFVHLSNSFRSLDLLSGMFPMSRSECKFENEERPLGRRKGKKRCSSHGRARLGWVQFNFLQGDRRRGAGRKLFFSAEKSWPGWVSSDVTVGVSVSYTPLIG